MLGLGETEDEIKQAMDDMREHQVDIVTFGQYLRPTGNHLPINRYVTPEEFDLYREWGLERGFLEVVSGPMVRSSYRAEQALLKNNVGISNSTLEQYAIPIKQAMKLFTLVVLIASLGLTGCQNPVRDPIDSVVQIVTDPKKEIKKGTRQYPFALAQSGGDLTQLPLTTAYLNGLIQRLAKVNSVSVGNSAG